MNYRYWIHRSDGTAHPGELADLKKEMKDFIGTQSACRQRAWCLIIDTQCNTYLGRLKAFLTGRPFVWDEHTQPMGSIVNRG